MTLFYSTTMFPWLEPVPKQIHQGYTAQKIAQKRLEKKTWHYKIENVKGKNSNNKNKK